MKSTIRGHVPLLWMLSIPILNVFYSLLNKAGPEVHSLMTDLDRLIPFIPAFIIPYVIWYPFIAVSLVIFFIRDRRTYYRALLTLCVGLLACYGVYAVFQTTVPRPDLLDKGWLYDWVRIIYANDQPYNCFPSIHVLTSYIMIKGLWIQHTVPAWLRHGLIVISWSIIASTVFVKQHVLLDSAGAILLVEMLFACTQLLIPLRTNSKSKPMVMEQA